MGKGIAGIGGGLVVGVLLSFLVGLSLAEVDEVTRDTSLLVAFMPELGQSAQGKAFWGGLGATIVVAALAPSAAKAWRRAFLVAGALSLASSLVLMEAGAEAVQEARDAAAGAAASGAVLDALSYDFVTLLLAPFALGLLFLALAFLIGRD